MAALGNRLRVERGPTEPEQVIGAASTRTTFQVASEAVQISGGNGVTRAYPVEKPKRDELSSIIEEGCDEVLAVKDGTYLIDPDMF